MLLAAAAVLGVTATDDWHASHFGLADCGDPMGDLEDDGGSPGHSAAELCLAILCALLSALAVFGFSTYPRRPLHKKRQKWSQDAVPVVATPARSTLLDPPLDPALLSCVPQAGPLPGPASLAFAHRPAFGRKTHAHLHHHRALLGAPNP